MESLAKFFRLPQHSALQQRLPHSPSRKGRYALEQGAGSARKGGFENFSRSSTAKLLGIYFQVIFREHSYSEISYEVHARGASLAFGKRGYFLTILAPGPCRRAVSLNRSDSCRSVKNWSILRFTSSVELELARTSSAS